MTTRMRRMPIKWPMQFHLAGQNKHLMGNNSMISCPHSTQYFNDRVCCNYVHINCMNLDIIQYACVLITSMMRFAGIVQSCLSKMPFSDSEPWPALQGEPESRHLRAHKSDTTFHQVSIQTKHHCMIVSSCHHLCLSRNVADSDGLGPNSQVTHPLS